MQRRPRSFTPPARRARVALSAGPPAVGVALTAPPLPFGRPPEPPQQSMALPAAPFFALRPPPSFQHDHMMAREGGPGYPGQFAQGPSGPQDENSHLHGGSRFVWLRAHRHHVGTPRARQRRLVVYRPALGAGHAPPRAAGRMRTVLLAVGFLARLLALCRQVTPRRTRRRISPRSQ